MTNLDFNRDRIASSEPTVEINALLDRAALKEQQESDRRDYLGASGIGSECLRQIQYQWQCDSIFPARTKRIFARGHAFEDSIAASLGKAGFRIERGTARTEFSTADNMFRGHADGIIVAGPVVPGLYYPCLWECKCLGDAGWKKLERDGLHKAYPHYYAQVQLYMAYLRLDAHPALFTAGNANDCSIVHLLVPFDAAAAQAASDRAVHVIKATVAHELLPRITENPADWRCRMCPHRERCWR